MMKRIDQKEAIHLLEQALWKMADTKSAIEEGIWNNTDEDWKQDLDSYIKRISRFLEEIEGK